MTIISNLPVSAAQTRSAISPQRLHATKVHATAATNSNSAVQQPSPFQNDAKALFTPVQLGELPRLEHRIVMAPLTRNRALKTVPVPAMQTYYSQRASPGGLIITEGTAICQEGQGYPDVPGIHSEEQIKAWKPIVQSVKDKGAVFLMQLWHCGRASHEDFQPDGRAPGGPSAIAVSEEYKVYTPKGGPFKYPVPRPLEESEIPAIIQAYADGAKNALAAGFDGVEIHGANGYLLDQFWKDSSNKRTDGYGGSIDKQGRLMVEVTKAVADAVGAGRVGLRLSPFNTFLSAQDSVERALEKNMWLMKELDAKVPGLAYIHMVEPRLASGNAEREVTSHKESLEPFRTATSRPFLAAGGFKRDSAIQAIEEGKADAVVFGRYFLSSPDLPKRIALDVPFNKYDRTYFYHPDPVKGYTDYPFMSDQSAGGATNGSGDVKAAVEAAPAGDEGGGGVSADGKQKAAEKMKQPEGDNAAMAGSNKNN